MKRLILYSGGMDSTVLLTQAVREVGPENVLALSLHYGSLHNSRESEAAAEICTFLNVLRTIITLPKELFAGGSSALMGDSEMPVEEYHDPTKETPSATIVPFRNANLISAAVAYAEGHGFETVSIAAHMNDAIGYAYPDCMPEFLEPMAQAVAFGTLHKVHLRYPYTENTKSDLVTIGAVVRAPLVLSWSCYRGGRVHCGECPTCLERQRAFYEAGYMDPTKYVVPSKRAIEKGLEVFPYGEKIWKP